jgi:hypothetical protein
MDTRIEELKCWDGIIRNVIAVDYQVNDKTLYAMQISGWEKNPELLGFESIEECVQAAYKAWGSSLCRNEVIGYISDKVSEENVILLIAFKIDDQWDMYLSPRKGEVVPVHLGKYSSIARCRRVALVSFGDTITMS